MEMERDDSTSDSLLSNSATKNRTKEKTINCNYMVVLSY